MTKQNRYSWSRAACIAAGLCSFTFVPLTDILAGPMDGGSGGSSIEAELARREAALLESNEDIAAGLRLEAEKDYEGAIGKYKSAIDRLVPAPMTQVTRNRAIVLFSDASAKLAHERALEGNFDSSRQLIDSVLVDDISPDHKKSKVMRDRLDDPDWYNHGITPQHVANVKEVERLLHVAHDYYEIGDFKNAELQYQQVLRVDRTNSAARRGMEEVELALITYHRSTRDHTRAKMLREVDETWETPVPVVSIQPGDRGPEDADSTGRAYISRKLNETTIPVVDFEDASVQEALEFLRQKSIEQDPFETDGTRKGVNFILNDTTSGAPVGAAAGAAPGASPITLRLTNVPLVEALKYVTELAGLKYKIEPYSVVVVPQWDTGGDMFTRSFRVPPDFINSTGGGGDDGGGAVDDPFAAPDGGGSGTSLKKKLSAKEILASQGVTFGDGASAIYSPRTSTLIVRNTQSNMELVEAFVDSIRENIQKQVMITSKFVEVTQQNTDELGFDWLLGGFNIPGSDRAFGSGGTVGNQLAGGTDPNNFPFVPPTGAENPVPTGVNPITSALRSGGNAIQSNAIDGLLNEVQVPTNVAPGIFGLAGVFTDPQFQMVIRALKQKKGADLMSAPSVVTRSGQRAKIEIIREFIYPTEYDPPEIPQNFGSSTLGGGGGGGFFGDVSAASTSSFPVTPANPTAFEMRPVGVTLEVDPVVGADGLTIELNIAPEVVEFEGFINYGSPIQSGAIDALGRPTTIVLTENRIEQPVFASRKLSTAVTIWDGQTVAIGGLIREDVQQTEDKIPFFGDLPLFGRFFKSNAESHFKRNLMIFVKAVLIDPAGIPINGPSLESAPVDGLFPN
jgi:general secretion pathway protein D